MSQHASQKNVVSIMVVKFRLFTFANAQVSNQAEHPLVECKPSEPLGSRHTSQCLRIGMNRLQTQYICKGCTCTSLPHQSKHEAKGWGRKRRVKRHEDKYTPEAKQEKGKPKEYEDMRSLEFGSLSQHRLENANGASLERQNTLEVLLDQILH